MLLIIRFTR